MFDKTKPILTKEDELVLESLYTIHNIQALTLEGFKQMCIENAVGTRHDVITSGEAIAKLLNN